jgi:ketosteroid isomerase-like protein
MNDSALRELCHSFFDAIEARDYVAVAELYDPDLRFWANVSGRELNRDESVAALENGAPRHRRRTYDDRVINTFEWGFVVQYSVNVVTHNGHHSSLWACLVAHCRDGRIVRLEEYLDSGKFSRNAASDGGQSQ